MIARRIAWRTVATAASAVTLAVACNAIVGIDAATLKADDDGGLPVVDAAPEATAPDAGVDAGGGDMCPHAFPPSRPTTEDATQDLEVVSALRSLDLGVRDDGGVAPPLGFDLDHVCTCVGTPPGAESCKARVLGATHCDDPSGRDNSGSQMLQKFDDLTSGKLLNEGTLNARISQGTYGLVIRVRHYNGGMNDKQVEISIFISNGTAGVDGGVGPTPAWAGNDAWTVDSMSVFGGKDQRDAGIGLVPNFVDTKGYVVGGVLVGSVDFPFTLGGGGQTGVLTLELTGSVITAQLVPEVGSFRLDNGALAGRWSTKKLLGSLGALNDPFGGGGFVCPGTLTYGNVKAQICSFADLFADPLQPNDVMVLCDALSIGMGFTGYPAVLGPVSARPPSPVNCPDAGPDDCN